MPEAIADPEYDNLGPLLSAELDRLPERFRAPIVLCYFQGLTHDQAARTLGWPVGTVRSRLARARDRLRERLAARGLEPGAMAFGLSELSRKVSVPDEWISTTVRASTSVTAGKIVAAGLAPASVAALTQGVLWTMFTHKLKLAAVAILASTLVIASTGVLVGQVESGGKKTPKKSDGGSVDVNRRGATDELSRGEPKSLDELKRKLVEAARDRLKAQLPFYEKGRIPIDRYLQASQNVMEAECAASTTLEERVTALRAYVERAKAVEAREKAELETGRGTVADVTEASEYRLKAEFQLATATAPAESVLGELDRRLKSVEEKLDRLIRDRGRVYGTLETSVEESPTGVIKPRQPSK